MCAKFEVDDFISIPIQTHTHQHKLSKLRRRRKIRIFVYINVDSIRFDAIGTNYTDVNLFDWFVTKKKSDQQIT